jgi:hypothetical protein
MAKRKADAAAEAAEAVAAASAAAEAALLASASVQSGSVGSAGDDVPMPELGTGQPQPQQPAPKRRRMTWMGTYVLYLAALIWSLLVSCLFICQRICCVGFVLHVVYLRAFRVQGYWDEY